MELKYLFDYAKPSFLEKLFPTLPSFTLVFSLASLYTSAISAIFAN